MITPSSSNSLHDRRYMMPGTGRHSIFRFSEKNNTGNGQKNNPDKKLRTEETADEQKLILVVEDTYENQFLANRFLTKAGYAVEIAENGVIAVDKFNKTEYDLILMDINMPEMDGFAATEAIRKIEKEQAKKSRIPIIAFTAHAVEGYEKRCLDNDMDDYITKPIKKKDFLQAVGNWVQSVHLI